MSVNIDHLNLLNNLSQNQKLKIYLVAVLTVISIRLGLLWGTPLVNQGVIVTELGLILTVIGVYYILRDN